MSGTKKIRLTRNFEFRNRLNSSESWCESFNPHSLTSSLPAYRKIFNSAEREYQLLTLISSAQQNISFYQTGFQKQILQVTFYCNGISSSWKKDLKKKNKKNLLSNEFLNVSSNLNWWSRPQTASREQTWSNWPWCVVGERKKTRRAEV